MLGVIILSIMGAFIFGVPLVIILEVAGKRTCPYCKARVPRRAVKCSHCGSTIRKLNKGR